MLKLFIEQLSPFLGLNEPPLAEEGLYTLAFEPNLQISLRENADSGITLHTTIAPLPALETDLFLQRLMEANLLGNETGRGVLGTDKEGKEITFTLFLPPNLSYKEFHDHLEDFTNYAEVWRDETLQFVNSKRQD